MTVIMADGETVEMRGASKARIASRLIALAEKLFEERKGTGTT